jgi:hypothetical protein
MAEDEKGDARRKEGGPGKQAGHGASGHTSANPETYEDPGPKYPGVRDHAPPGNRDRHADKQQAEEAGPGRDSRTPPDRGRY